MNPVTVKLFDITPIGLLPGFLLCVCQAVQAQKEYLT